MRSLIPGLLLLLATAVTAQAPEPAGRPGDVKRGMTPQQVRDLLGPPAHVARQIFYQGVLEQWVYERPEPCRVDILHPLGQERQVQAVHTPAQRRP